MCAERGGPRVPGKAIMSSRKGLVAFAVMTILCSGCCQAARISIESLAYHSQRGTNSRDLLQRSRSARNSDAIIDRHQQVDAVSAAASTPRPRSSQQGSISARSSRSAEESTRTAPDTIRSTSDRLESGSISTTRRSTSSSASSRDTVDRQAVSRTAPVTSIREPVERTTSTRRDSHALDFGSIPSLDLGAGLENMQKDLSGLVDELKQQGGFWKEGSLQDNISNMVQLGVKGALGVVSPIVNGITGGIPITVPSVNGRCLQGKPIHSTTTGLFGNKKRVTKCLIGTGSQVADYLSKAAGSLAGMAGQVLDRPAGSEATAGSGSEAGATAGAGQPAAAAAPVAAEPTGAAPTGAASP